MDMDEEQGKFKITGKRSRQIGALVCAVVTLALMGAIYGAEFCFPNTEKGRLEAVKAYAAAGEGEVSRRYEISYDTEMRAAAFEERDGWLYIFYTADNEENVHGILTLEKGINGRFRPIRSQQGPFPYDAGVWSTDLTLGKKGLQALALAGENCTDIKAVKLIFAFDPSGMQSSRDAGVQEKVYPVNELDFLRILDGEALWGVPEPFHIFPKDVRFLDENGNDITEKHRDETVKGSWGSGTGSAELGTVYVLMAITGFVGAVLVRYFLWDEENNLS